MGKHGKSVWKVDERVVGDLPDQKSLKPNRLPGE